MCFKIDLCQDEKKRMKILHFFYEKFCRFEKSAYLCTR